MKTVVMFSLIIFTVVNIMSIIGKMSREQKAQKPETSPTYYPSPLYSVSGENTKKMWEMFD
jgi:hypothetical protein